MRKAFLRVLDQRPARTSGTRGRSVRRAWLFAFIFLVAFVTLLITPSGYARLIFDVTDPAFNGATLEPFAPGDAPQGATSLTIMRNGVQFTFSTTNPQGLFFCSGGNCTLRAPFPEGIDIQMSPAVAAIGFRHSWVECPGSVTFDGNAGSETFALPNFSGPRSFFVGASDIGSISHVRLESRCGPAERLDDMLFVPLAPPPSSPTPTPAQSDLVVRKTGPAFAGNNERVTFDVTVANSGPDAATGVQVVDFLPSNATLASTLPAATLNGSVATINLADIPPNFGNRLATLDFDILPFPAFGCGSKLVNVALATSSSLEGNRADNLAWSVTSYDNDARRATSGEICGNSIDDNCDGRADCADPGCGCLPPLRAVGGSTPPQCIFLLTWTRTGRAVLVTRTTTATASPTATSWMPVATHSTRTARPKSATA